MQIAKASEYNNYKANYNTQEHKMNVTLTTETCPFTADFLNFSTSLAMHSFLKTKKK